MSSPDIKPKKLRVLNLEDNSSDSELIQAELETEWTAVELLRVDTREAFVQALDEFKPDVILSDFQLPGFNGRSALNIARQSHPEIPFIIVTGALADIEAVELVKLGAKDYVMKDHLQRLTSAVQSALSLEQGIRARKSMESALQQSEADLKALVEHSPIAMLVDVGVDVDEQIVMMNQQFTELFGYTLEDVPDVRHWWPLAYPDEKYREETKAEWIERVEKAIQSHCDIKPMETIVTCKDGSIRYVRISLASIGSRNIVTFEDLTERKQAEAKIQRLNQLYAALSYCNQAIVRSTNEVELFAQTCKVAVQFGGFKMAWIGVLDPDTRMVKSVFSFGEAAEEYLRDIKISADAASAYGQGPTGRALRENQPFWCQDFLHSPLTIPWHERGATLGWRSSAALPLCREGVVFGALTLYSCEPNAFDEAARELLIEMSADINFALDTFRHDAERKRVEKSLLESEEKFRVMSASAQDAIVMIDNDENISFWNAAAEKIFGYAAHQALGQNMHLLLTPARFHEASSKGFAHFQHSGEGAVVGKTLELMALHQNGNEFPVELSLSAVNISGCWQAIGIIRDITDRKKIETALRINEEIFRRFMEFSPIYVFFKDANMRSLHLSKNYETMLHKPLAELIGKSMDELFPSELAQSMDADDLNVLHTGKTMTIEESHNGRIYSTIKFPIHVDGKPRYLAGYTIDITDRKQFEAIMTTQYELAKEVNEQLMAVNLQLAQAQSQLLQSEKMAAIGLLAAGVAHEINNPIAYVNSNLGTLEKYLADIFVAMDKYESVEVILGTDNPLLDELRLFKSKVDLNYIRGDTKALIAESHQGLERVKKIILDLKEFSYTDREDQWIWANVHQGLESTLNVVWNELKYKCDVVKEYATLPDIYCLPAQLNQVFMNLLINAAQAIEVRGTITLRSGQEGDRIWIEVSDTGKGIPEKDFPHLFDPFFTTKPVGKGTGLGLSVSYKIVEKHHGKIEVHSEMGKGSTFRVWLPVQQPDIKETK